MIKNAFHAFGQVGMTESDSFSMWDHRQLTQQAGKLYTTGAWIMAAYVLLGTGHLMSTHLEQAMAFLMMSLPGVAVLLIWNRWGQRGLAVFPLMGAQLAFLNSVPLLTGAETVEDMTSSTLWGCAQTMLLFQAALTAGWWLGLNQGRSRSSQWNMTGEDSRSNQDLGFKTAFPLLGMAFLFHFSNFTGLLYRLLPGSLAGVMPVLYAAAGASLTLGSLLGGISVAKNPRGPKPTLFWLMIGATFFITVSGLLLSAAVAMVFGCIVGLALGSRRIPWAFLIISISVVSFLNQGKFIMRERYWGEEDGLRRVTLAELPSFYAEWTTASLSTMSGNWAFLGDDSRASGTETGQNFAHRLNNLQNLSFILDALDFSSAQPLYGRTYALIPSLLIPRFIWPDKPRTHEGQVILNLTFGRQTSEEDTFRTYVAWGLLPEAVANFGWFGGALLLGLVAGTLCGLLEMWSSRKRLFSVEGLIATALLVQTAVSYEMVASVFVTSTFQMLVAVTICGFALRYWIGRSKPAFLNRKAPLQPNASLSS